jgi:acetylornithine deacetylase/succinyl-diaminopimelate desuccinylase-like protein
MSAIEPILAAVDTGLEAALERLFALIRIPSVSTDPAHSDDCRAAADWLVRDLESLGAGASTRITAGLPMVVGHLPGPEGAPHVLFYGHYDVQPAGDPALWDFPAFEPSLAAAERGETHIRGRGASDDKGALMSFVEACRAFVAVRGSLPLKVSFLFEGEEESGSRSMAGFLEETAAELSCDAVLVCDSDQWDAETPAVTTMIRGICSQEISVTCASRDLHSGIYGNAARNALGLLVDLLASLRRADGGVAIEGFYDGVAEVPDSVQAIWSRLPFDGEGFLGDVGLSVPAGEAGRSVSEQVWTRPSCDIHGIWGGYSDPGFKTVIPAEAHAKLSFRLVAGQEPERIKALFQRHIRERMPADCRVSFQDHTMGRPTTMPVDGPFLQATLAALRDEWGDVAVAGTGGSIPIVGALKEATGADALLVGFAALSNRIHAPNEKFDLSSFHRGTRSWVRILDALSRVRP